MKVSHKSKRVSWASDVNLCQVRLFLSEECPSQVGLDSQDHLQAKSSLLSHPSGVASSDDVLPPGFEAAHPTNQLQTKLSQIPTIKWKSPSRFVLDFTWQVVAGEESEEAAIQNQREMRVLEAVYPRPSAIPPNPSVLPSAEDSPYDDLRTPSIPITPVEDEDSATDTLSEPITLFDVSRTVQSLHHSTGLPSSSQQHNAFNVANPPGSDNPTAATEPSFLATALTGLTNSNDQGNLIDRELLFKILSNPKMVEKLVTDYGTTNTTHNNNPPQPLSRSPAIMTLSEPSPAHGNRTLPPQTTYSHPNGVAMGHLPNSRPTQFPPPQQAVPASHVTGPAKDLSYYKSLIQQHGGDRQEPTPPPPPPQYGNNRYNNQPPVTSQEQPVNGQKPRGESKQKIMKPCIYFNSSRGCRHGANCAYQHDASFQQRGSSVPELQSAKRTKFDREISS